MVDIAENIKHIRNKIIEKSQEHDLARSDVQLVAVSKKQPIERVKEALAAGHRLFGENRVQEAGERWEDLRPDYPDLQLHLIGPLQTNKIKEAVALFDFIHTVDREKLASKLAEEMERQNRDLPCLIQVNTGEEDQKSGIHPKSVPEFADFCRYECGLDIRGLMCIPPLDEPPAPHFALLKKLANENDLTELSMGMSSDFEKAIPLGATYVRVGSALFGERK